MATILSSTQQPPMSLELETIPVRQATGAIASEMERYSSLLHLSKIGSRADPGPSALLILLHIGGSTSRLLEVPVRDVCFASTILKLLLPSTISRMAAL